MHQPPGIRRAEFHVAIPAQRLIRHYRGHASAIVVTTTSGVRLQLPAAAMRRFITREGLYGTFRVAFSEAHRLQSIERLA